MITHIPEQDINGDGALHRGQLDGDVDAAVNTGLRHVELMDAHEGRVKGKIVQRELKMKQRVENAL